jgi:hypothetical protein
MISHFVANSGKKPDPISIFQYNAITLTEIPYADEAQSIIANVEKFGVNHRL